MGLFILGGLGYILSIWNIFSIKMVLLEIFIGYGYDIKGYALYIDIYI